MKTPTRIAIAVVEHEGCYLIGQRPAGAALAGWWEFPGGKIEAGESPAEAAVRECEEEAGLVIRIERPLPVATHDYNHGSVELNFFLGHPVEPASPPRHPFRWVNHDELGRYEFPAGNRELLELLGSMK